MARTELVETSLRHGQQVLLLSRLRQRHAVPVAQLLDACGFAALDVFGGTTFEAQISFLGEDPFARLRAIREVVTKTPLLATVAGQALVGHRHVADDVVDAFIGVCADAGVDRVRIFDPLNDVRNVERAIAASRDRTRDVEGVIVYSDRPEGTDWIATLAAGLAERGCTRLCLHDPLGVMTVASTRKIVGVIRSAADLPLTLSISSQTGQSDLAYFAGLEAGAVGCDVSLGPLAGGAGHPAAEAIAGALKGSDVDPELDLAAIADASLALETGLVHYGDIMDPLAMRLDTSALLGLLPPSAMGHALTELRDRNALDRLGDVENEVARVRAELGFPPFVTPLTELVSTQAVYNVTEGDRYATVTQEVKDYCLGLYGTPPVPMDADVTRAINGREEPITLRPADLLDPAMAESTAELKREGIDATPDAVVTHALFSGDYIAWARGELEPELLGDEVLDDPVAPAESAASLASSASSELAAEPTPAGVRELTVEVDGQAYSVRVTGAGSGSVPFGTAAAVATSAPITVREGTVVAPMQGLLVKVSVGVGDQVEVGGVVAVLEAMKMQNDIPATKSGRVTDIFVQEGAVVRPKDPILQIQ